MTLLFLLTLVTLAVVFWVASEAPNLPKGTLLRIDLVGEVKESGPAEPSFMLSMFGQDSFDENTRLADVVDALDRAAHDDRIAGVVLRVDDLAGAGMASIREIGAAIDRYRQRTPTPGTRESAEKSVKLDRRGSLTTAIFTSAGALFVSRRSERLSSSSMSKWP